MMHKQEDFPVVLTKFSQAFEFDLNSLVVVC